jgi:ornithine cyclodeaminase
MRIYSASDVRAALPMALAIDVMRSAFAQLAAGQAVMPPRTRLQGEHGLSLVMPALLRDSQDLAVKVVSVMSGNPDLGLPAVVGTVLVLDPRTGLPLALLDGAALTAIRTGAGGGLAADLLARADSRTLTVFGAGVQARVQVEAVRVVRPIETVWVVSRTRAPAQALVDELRMSGVKAAVPVEVGAAVAASDIIITATSAPTPVFAGRAIRPGTHLTAVGAHTADTRELDADCFRTSYTVVDSFAAAQAEAGDLLLAGAAAHAELGQIVLGLRPGRTTADQITIFKSVGVAAQDAAAAGAVVRALAG